MSGRIFNDKFGNAESVGKARAKVVGRAELKQCRPAVSRVNKYVALCE